MDQKTNPDSTYYQTSLPQEIHLTDYLNIIRKRKWLIISFFLVLVSLVTVNTFRTTPVYKATTKILIERQFLAEPNIENAMSRENQNLESYQTQQNLLKSRSLASKVIEDLELWKDFASRRDDNSDSLTSSSDKPNNSGHSPDISNVDTPIEQSKSNIASRMVGWYLSNLNVEQIPGSQIFKISFISPIPEITVRVADAHARAFIESSMQTQYEEYQQVLDWLKTQLEEQKNIVEESERAIHEYKKNHDIIFFDDQKGIVSPKLIELNNILIQANANRIEKQTAYDQLKSFSVDKESLFTLPEIKQNSVISQLRSKLVDLKAQKMEMSSMYRSRHPKILEINSTIKQLEQEIINEVQRVSKAIKAELDRAIAFEDSIRQALDEHKQVSMSLNEKGINYDVLRREAQSNQNIYDILLKQAREVSVISNTNRSNIRIMDEAVLPRNPIKPRKAVNILLSIVLGLTFGIGLAFFFEYMDKSVRTPEDVTRHLGMTVLGMIPFDKSLKGRKTLTLPQWEAHNKVRKYARGYYNNDISTNIIPSFSLMQPRMSGQILIVESSASGEGKSTILARSAINLARGGLRVTMVDADVQRPSLHNIFKLNGTGENGLIKAISNVLSQNIQHGTLDKYSVDDLFSLIALKKESGRLTITNDNLGMTAVFDKGCLFHVQSHRDVHIANRLGTMLLRGGFITENQLKDALDRNKRTGQPLGYILLNAGYLNQSQLQGPLKLQMEERLQKLFSWNQGAFTFERGNVETYEDKKICFEEDYVPIINRLGRMNGSRLLEKEVLSCVKPLDEPNLSLLPVGTGSEKSDGLLYFTLLAKFLDILKQHYNIVLVDAPPLLDTMSSVKPLLSMVDNVILVIKPGQVSIKNIKEAVSCIKESQTRIIGAVLNQVKNGQGYY